MYGLPGGYISHEETIERAAEEVLKHRTGLDHIFLKQFKVYSDPVRSVLNPAVKALVQQNPDADMSFFEGRFVTVGFYALVEYTEVTPTPDPLSEACEWVNINEIHHTMLDHGEIIEGALKTLRRQLSYTPIGYNLLTKKFTMPELQRLYETILDRPLDRRNFQRKILSYDILNRLDEKRQGVAHKAPYLYEFNLENYQRALDEGLNNSW